MRPPLAIARRVRITVLVRELVMLTMRAHPQERAAFQSRDAANCKKVLKPLGCDEGAMGEQAVKTNAEPQASGNPVQKNRDEQPFPTEEEKRRHSANVKHSQDRHDSPVQPLFVRLMLPRIVELQLLHRGQTLPVDATSSRRRQVFQIAHIASLGKTHIARNPARTTSRANPQGCTANG